ncbi:MAG: MotA/TolQ/ExbB proton channel family protein [Verrucomicrobiae bacterium]|nr:MotA/TolQ/ExbB proton channel family protein [Verrucomicrobiae bacterium]
MKFLPIALLSFAAAVRAAAQTVAPAAGALPASAPVSAELSLWELLVAGGWVMIPLLVISVIAVALILYYLLALRASRVATPEFSRQAGDLIQKGDWGRLADAARREPQALARVIETTLTFAVENPDVGGAAIREVAQSEGNRQSAALTQMVVYLMDVGVLAPMLGLFGTVVGILRSFGSIASEATPMRTMLLAGGVSQALVATAAGLVVGILAMFFYSWFRGRVQGLISDLEAAATPLVGAMISRLGKN